ncbi:Na(+)/H(+) antiporter subunit G [Clostridium liquoris]|jgi:multicomponent Na+:H+ antiporter subunit G|uniref:Na(+)/H(+) antiporter subunit G n=1 Tax=Clostridium liquoris TaxID=1289519 RepID=A0A2T0B4X9_9CLOT|nr:monovalent cation/H(+) antiporter subunit G [Clostridium liquoris]PRR78922.1 Na(+)/H(+) antiporter subunit G [Clostridium liquoris]
MIKTIIAGIFIFGGLFFFMVGTLGILRFPDVFTRIHSAAKCDTLGALLSLMGLIIFNGFNWTALKLILVLIFIWITNPTATHLIGKAEYLRTLDEGAGINKDENI